MRLTALSELTALEHGQQSRTLIDMQANIEQCRVSQGPDSFVQNHQMLAAVQVATGYERSTMKCRWQHGIIPDKE